ncbi:bluetail domain-containing putative surface protein [Pannonibacter sp. P2PFMT1]|uniref:beta strand repeat-containing protein n=1 Tax=Pannonibacter sp. P2PFMT1 TaxID=2003582 RepID=UPI002739FED8|nr:bluetail domain-containing putative surface protein [Pannonibacter sp. P2PFMT1]
MALAFDATYYLSARPDVFNAFVATAGSTGLTWAQFAERHYDNHGRFEGANPNTTFNTKDYLTANPDVAAAGVNPFTHFMNFGAAEGRAPSATFPSFASFDDKAYLAANADLAAAGITTKNAAYAHFVKHGQFEGRPGAPVVDSGVPGQTFTLTTGVDNIVGTANNDTINGVIGTAATTTLNAFDSINGGAGVDTLNISANAASNFALPAATKFSGIEVVNVSQAASGGTGTGALTVTNSTFGAGVQKFNYVDASAAADMTAAAVSVTLNSATDVSVAAKGTGTFTTVAVVDKSTTASERGSTLKTVTIEKASGAATLDGNAISTVNLSAVAGLTTVNAAAGTRELTVNASGTTNQGGLTDAQATSVKLNVSGAQNFGTLTVAKAADVSINANAATTATVTAAAAKTLNIGGSNLLTLTAGAGNAALETVKVTGAGGVTVDLSGIGTLTSVDTSGSTAAKPASGTATGANTITIGNQVAYTGGAGQDVVTVGATTKAINLGGGNDTAVVNTTALAAGGSINGGDGVNTLKLSNANAVTLSAAGATQTAFKTAVTNFSTLDITAMDTSTISLSGFGTFNKVVMATAAQTQTFSGVTSGTTFRMDNAANATGVTINALTAPNDVISFELAGDLSGGVKAYGNLTLPGVETVNLSMVDTNAAFTATLATATVVDAVAQVINVSGNNGLALTHAGTALHTLNAGGLTKGAITFTSGALSTDATVTGSASGNDTLNFASALGKVTMTVAGGDNVLTGSSTAANTITGGTGADKITGGAAVDTINGGAGADIIAGLAGKDVLTGGAGADTFVYTTSATSVGAGGANVDKILDFVAGTDKIGLTQGNGTLLGTVDIDGATTVGTMNAMMSSATSVADLAAVYTQLANVLTAGEFAASATGANGIVARVVEFTTGAAAGKYLVVNDHQAGFNAATDLVIDVTGVVGTITNADFAYSANFFA